MFQLFALTDSKDAETSGARTIAHARAPGETFNNYLFPLYCLHQMVRGADGSDVRRGAETEHTGRETRAEEQQIQHH